ncbi:cytochrome P450, family 71, subfamily B, polypeptide 36 [Prunus dulcis]|uniref:Cytochrome P450, family 71, subfamily B, polypeptide 36 n=1 Tax=Prunus dulcis TaxID=3755 RepID=A0A4Y1QNQ9_PRUDU|nr:cytochrome P450, family 71, subfamily B, polypeptide 36 [Prunus dulcis]
MPEGNVFQEKAREVDEESNEMILRTSATTMTRVMADLARKPKLMKKAQEEVRRCFGNKGNISERDTTELQYVKMIVKDTRLHPPAPMIIPRENMAHFKIQGYDIDSKTLVFVNG